MRDPREGLTSDERIKWIQENVFWATGPEDAFVSNHDRRAKARIKAELLAKRPTAEITALSSALLRDFSKQCAMRLAENTLSWSPQSWQTWHSRVSYKANMLGITAPHHSIHERIWIAAKIVAKEAAVNE